MIKKAQSWYVDYAISLAVFALGLLILFQYIPNLSDDNIDELSLDARILSDSILSEGIPSDWDNETLVKIGLLTNGSIDSNKWIELKDVEYSKALSILPISSDFVIFFESENTLLGIGGEKYYGKENANSTNINELFNPTEIVSVQRLVTYNGKIIIMNVRAWYS